MRKSYFLILLCSISLSAFSQPYGNEWINYSQKYFKFPITKNGVYRIDYNTIMNAGIPIGNIDPRGIQLLGRGKEVPLYIQGEADSVFDNTDFIEFYAKRNDAWLDSLAYDTPNSLVNPYYSLFNDTAYYFLTWDTITNHSRMVVENDVATGLYSSQPYFFKEAISYHKDEYFHGVTNLFGSYDPEFSDAEGWATNSFGFNATRLEFLSTKNLYLAGPNALFKANVISSSDDVAFNGDNHLQVNCSQTHCYLILFLMVIKPCD